MREAGAPDQPFRQFIEEKYGAEDQQEIKRLALAYVEGFNAASADRISAAALVVMEGAASAVSGGAAFRIGTAMTTWPTGCSPVAIRRESNCASGVVANEIGWSRGDVEVIASSRAGHSPPSFRAERAIIILPLGVVQRHQTLRAQFASIRS
jgi:hypothetical protein